MSKLLDNVNMPEDLLRLEVGQLKQLAEEIREYITDCVSKTGGHLASNLGMVEAAIAMHYVFDFKKDKLLFDVGHQCYTHKILTGRKEGFKQLRKEGGVSGFPSPAESQYDQFAVGHAGTAIPTAVGMAMGQQLQDKNDRIVSVVGDASIVNGASFEGMNNLAMVKRQLLIVLNDNSMAIDVTQGAMAKYLSKIRLSHTYEDMRKTANTILEHVPLIGRKVEGAIEKFKKTLRMAISASQLFESMNIAYFGPVNGHDIEALIDLFKAIKDLDHPAILHIYTKKGKGFTPAEDGPKNYHSTGPFEINGEAVNGLGKKGRSWTDCFADAMVKAGKKNDKIVAITAAMPDGTGLVKFREKFPDRCFDVGIAESAAVDIAAGMAKEGLRPIVSIYSTFLQRSYDFIFQEVALQNLPVAFAVDRAGFVGSDGATHHGVLDIGYLRGLPNMVLAAPACEAEMEKVVEFATSFGGPVAFRYPKDAVDRIDEYKDRLSAAFEVGEAVWLEDGDNDIVLVGYGDALKNVIEAAKKLKEQDINVDVVNARFAKPIDEKIVSLVLAGKNIITVEDHNLATGFGSAVLEAVNEKTAGGEIAGKVMCLGRNDEFVRHAARDKQLDWAGINVDGIVEAAIKWKA